MAVSAAALQSPLPAVRCCSERARRGRRCLAGAGELLQRVDNIFLEIQDFPSNSSSSMYVDRSGQGAQLSIGQMDEQLGRYHFVRQYCEDNAAHSTKQREFNCLWTRRDANALWVTGRPQNGKPSVLYDMSVAPRFALVRYVAPLLTAHTPGILNPFVADRLSPNPTECVVHDCDRPRCSPPDNGDTPGSWTQHKAAGHAALHGVSPSCWQASTSNHADQPSQRTGCEHRYETLQAAMHACALSSDWCGSVVRDGGMPCGCAPHRLVYHLRSSRQIPPRTGMSAWRFSGAPGCIPEGIRPPPDALPVSISAA